MPILFNFFQTALVLSVFCITVLIVLFESRAFSQGLPIVKPEWIVDSVASNALLSCKFYIAN
jgi:hypothetical protein